MTPHLTPSQSFALDTYLSDYDRSETFNDVLFNVQHWDFSVTLKDIYAELNHAELVDHIRDLEERLRTFAA